MAPAGGLLGGEERVGIERLVECFQCCMWSSMLKKTTPTVSSGAPTYSSSALEHVAYTPSEYMPPTNPEQPVASEKLPPQEEEEEKS
jgi:hypothetical protein